MLTRQTRFFSPTGNVQRFYGVPSSAKNKPPRCMFMCRWFVIFIPSVDITVLSISVRPTQAARGPCTRRPGTWCTLPPPPSSCSTSTTMMCTGVGMADLRCWIGWMIFLQVLVIFRICWWLRAQPKHCPLRGSPKNSGRGVSFSILPKNSAFFTQELTCRLDARQVHCGHWLDHGPLIRRSGRRPFLDFQTGVPETRAGNRDPATIGSAWIQEQLSIQIPDLGAGVRRLLCSGCQIFSYELIDVFICLLQKQIMGLYSLGPCNRLSRFRICCPARPVHTFGPLLNAATSIIFEGVPTHPDQGLA